MDAPRDQTVQWGGDPGGARGSRDSQLSGHRHKSGQSLLLHAPPSCPSSDPHHQGLPIWEWPRQLSRASPLDGAGRARQGGKQRPHGSQIQFLCGMQILWVPEQLLGKQGPLKSAEPWAGGCTGRPARKQGAGCCHLRWGSTGGPVSAHRGFTPRFPWPGINPPLCSCAPDGT